MEPLPFRGVCVLHAPFPTSPQRLREEITSVAGEALEDNGGFSSVFLILFLLNQVLDVSSLFGSEQSTGVLY